ncbi:hypothetical protein CC80DRAFT_42075 [Byssothecium circinans]|uniref:Uncharacterized protein n=1 Tax=Byssothecium circinans TaxID=147558 RepID=A0A6A5TXC7_9PLEO|nr:hypothetical protein CC80DRAFT_42075 [Byssothecium circinans]
MREYGTAYVRQLSSRIMTTLPKELRDMIYEELETDETDVPVEFHVDRPIWWDVSYVGTELLREHTEFRWQKHLTVVKGSHGFRDLLTEGALVRLAPTKLVRKVHFDLWDDRSCSYGEPEVRGAMEAVGRRAIVAFDNVTKQFKNLEFLRVGLIDAAEIINRPPAWQELKSRSNMYSLAHLMAPAKERMRSRVVYFVSIRGGSQALWWHR